MTDKERLEIFQQVETGCVSDAMIHFGIGAWMKGILPADPEARIYGKASTAYFDIVTPPRECLTQYELIELCEDGEVMVWNADVDTQIMGGNIYQFAMDHGINGIVIQGHTRDYGEIQKAGGAVFSLGQAIGSSPTNFRATKETVNIPVAVGGVVVRPGDYIFGDIDGVMVIPYEHVDKVLEQALLYMEWEAKIEVAIKKGLNAQEMKKVYQEIRFIDEN